MTRELLIGTYTERLPHVDGHAEGVLSATFDGTTSSRAKLRVNRPVPAVSDRSVMA